MSADARHLAGIAAWLRAHPDVLSGPSVRATIATAQVHRSLGAVTGDGDLLRAALLTLPHRMRVRAGADAEELVRQAVAGHAAPAADEPDDEQPSPIRELELRLRTLFALGDGAGRERGPGRTASRTLTDRQAVALLDDLLAPSAGRLVSDGAAHERRTRSSASERLAPTPRRPGDRSIDISVRATVHAAARSGRPLAVELRTQARRPTASLDVVLALDVSGSMLDATATGVAQALAFTLAHGGHRVAVLVFSDTVTEVCQLTSDPRRLLAAAAAFEPRDPTNLELALDRSRELLLRHGSVSRSRRVILVTDAQATAFARRRSGRFQAFGAGAARNAAVLAATRCVRAGVSVSLLCPAPGADARPDLEFAARLADAGGGHMRCYPTASGGRSQT